MSRGLKLSVYFGERDRVDGGFLADALLSVLEASGVSSGILMRAVEGFGAKHARRTDRLLTLSEDLPMVLVGIDRPDRIERAAAEIERAGLGGLVTIERARLPEPPRGVESLRAETDDESVKLTIYLGRGRRIGGRPAHRVVVDRLREAGVEGASVLLGIDGLLGGARQRAKFFAGNEDVPAMIVSVGSTTAMATAIAGLDALPGETLVTLERARVCKRDGVRVRPLPELAEADERGAPRRQKLILYTSESARVDGRPVHVEAIRRLRLAGAAGATGLRGIWGFDGSHAPHGDSLRAIRRRVPTLTVVVDTPANARRWFDLLDELTPERGLITSEVVPSPGTPGSSANDGG